VAFAKIETRPPDKPCKLPPDFGFAKSILHGMTLFVLWHDSLCHVMRKKVVSRKTVK